MKKYGYNSAIVSSVVVRDSKPQTMNDKEITSILDSNDNLIFLTGFLNNSNVLYSVNIHKEFCTNDNINVNECINYLLSEHENIQPIEEIEIFYTN